MAMIASGVFSPPPMCAGDPSPQEKVRTEIIQLRALIAHHDELYFRQAAPEISDAAYDDLKRRLARLEESTEIFGERAGIGDDRTSGFKSYGHRQQMLSLDKAYSEAELRAFQARISRAFGAPDLRFVVEPKIDGIAVSATFERGRLVQVLTRGNGLSGDDVMKNALTIEGFPRELRRDPAGDPLPERIEIRGEIFISHAEFARINRVREALGEPVFAHPRSLAAGTLKLHVPAEVAERTLAVVFYGWGIVEPMACRPPTQEAFHAQLRAWGVPALPGWRVAVGAEELSIAVKDMERERATLAFPTDGVVVKLDEVAPREVLGASERAPRWAVAYKFSAERVETRVNGITLQVGRSGVLTPVAELEPVTLGGATVSRVTLHNVAEIARHDLRVGDFVVIEKAGEIIPAVVGVNTGRRSPGSAPYVFPNQCPACGAGVQRRVREVAIYCPARACAGQVKARVLHFASKNGVGIAGLGEQAVGALVESGAVKSCADLYRLTREDLMARGGAGEKSADKLLREIAASQGAELSAVIRAVGVPQVGEVAAVKLANAFGGLDELSQASAETLAKTLGWTKGQTVAAFFAEPGNRALIEDLRGCGLGVGRTEGKVTAGSLRGKVFALTGRLPSWSRAEAERFIKEAGGVVTDDVTQGTDFLVAGEDAGAKRHRALALGISLVDEAGLKRMIAVSVSE